MKSYSVYKMVHRETGKTHVFTHSKSLSKKLKRLMGKKENYPDDEVKDIGHALLKYGKDAFDVSVLGVAKTPTEAFELRNSFIVALDCLQPKGYTKHMDLPNSPGSKVVLSIPEVAVETEPPKKKKIVLRKKPSAETREIL